MNNDQGVLERTHHLFTLSARSEQAIRQAALKLSRHLDQEPDQSFGDLAYTLHVGRRKFNHRLSLVAASPEELRDQCLAAVENPWELAQELGAISYHQAGSQVPHIAFLFSGQGSQSIGMGKELYDSSPAFRRVMDECAAILEPYFPVPFLQYLWNPQFQAELDQIHVCSAAMFVVEYALAKLWMSWGVKPSVVIGHSLGEYVAACIAGVMSLEDALKLVAERGRLMHEGTEPGGMLSILGTPKQVQQWIEPYQAQIAIATINGPQQIVVSGRLEALYALMEELERAQIVHKLLPISIASHSPLMEPIVGEYRAFMQQIEFKPNEIPLVSNLTAEWMTGQVLDAEYWCRHLRQTVQFAGGVQTLVDHGVTAFLEMGPHPVLKTLVESIAVDAHCVAGSLNRKENDWKTIQTSLGQLWALGCEVDWQAFDQAYKRRRVHAPTYPFERKSYWISVDGVPNTWAGTAQEVAATVESIAPADIATNRSTAELIRAFWQQVLGRSEIKPDDDFLQLGGDSLTMIQVKSRIKKFLQLDIPVKEMFTYPTFAEFVAYVESLRQQTEAEAEADLEIPPAERKELYPLSHTQRRLWFLYKMDPQSTAYHITLTLAVEGRVEVETMQAALQYLVDRHGALRTVFQEVDGIPYQWVREELPFRLHFEDISDRTRDAQLTYGRERIRQDRETPFDLLEGPLMRAMLFKRSEEEYFFYVNQHHIITDGWSLDLFMKELSAAYCALAEGGRPRLKRAVQFIDYVEWYEREMADQLEKEERFWLERLAKPLPVLDLPTDFPRPELQTFAGSSVKVQVPQPLVRSLQAFGQQEGVSLYMVLLSAYKLLLRHLSQEEDIIVGIPIMGRTVQALESTLGFFSNSVAIRTRFADITTVRDLLQEITRQSLDAFEHQSYPFDQLIGKINPDRDMSRSPIFSTFFVYRNSSQNDNSREEQPIRFTAPTDEAGSTGLPGSKFDLTLIVDKAEEQTHLVFEYNSELFLAHTVERFAAAYQNILELFLSQYETPIRSLDLLVAEEQELYRQLNQVQAPFDAGRTLPERFYEQVHLHPDRIALSDMQCTMTYRNLNEQSNRIAHLLCERGVGKERVVGLVLERSLEAVVAILGILKAGGAYVPIDPQYPEDRVRYMLEDSGATLLITRKQTAEWLGLEDSEQVICWEELPTHLPTADVEIEAAPENLAYMIYTSGSTGAPKGTELHHVGVANLVDWQKLRFGYSEQDIILQFASFSFDASVWEMFPALLNGAHLHLLSTEARQSVSAFAAEVERLQATTVTLPTVFFNQISRHLDEADVDKLRTMKRIFVAGEALQGEVVRAWQRRFGERILVVNAYGPTETTVCATYYPVEREVDEATVHIPIGTPIANTRVYILNPDMQLCPVNGVGELFVESVGLARGYRNQPEKTQAAFLPHPFSETPSATLYRTGDLVRLLPSGQIEFVGRRDDQLKVRGHRVELGEIEEHLLKVQGVSDGAVVAKKQSEGSSRLLAFYTTEAELKPEDVRAELAKGLPDYMVPTAINRLDAMPLTPNGKVDRKRLQSLEVQASAERFVAPQTAVETVMADVWVTCLGRENIGIHDNFFSLGGDSIISMQVVAFLNQQGISVRVPDLFRHQTIGELAQYVEANGLQNAPAQPERKAVSGEVPLAPIQRWMFEQTNIDHEYYLLPIMVEMNREVDPAILKQVLQMILEHHDMLRATYRIAEGQVTQWVLPPEEAQLELKEIDLSALDAHRQVQETRSLEAELKQSIKFADGLMLKAALLKYGTARYRLLWVIHHLLDDVVSQRILVIDLMTLYENLLKGKAAQLPQRTASYTEWVQTSRRQMQGAEGARAIAYWKPLLEAAEAVGATRIPVDFPTGSNRIADRLTLSVTLDPNQTDRLLTAVVDAHRTTIKEVLLAAVVRSVAKWSGQELVALSVEGHGRDSLEEENALDLSRTVGWFTSMYPIFAKVEAGETERETVQQIGAQLAAMPHGGASFTMLQAFSQDERMRELFDRFQMPEISYNYLGQLDNEKTSSGNWEIAAELVPNNPPTNERPAEVFLIGSVRRGELVMRFDFSKERYRMERAERLCQLFRAEIEAMLSQA